MRKLLRENGFPLMLGGLSLLLSWWLYAEHTPSPPPATASFPTNPAAASPTDIEQRLWTVISESSDRSISDQAPTEIANSADRDQTKPKVGKPPATKPPHRKAVRASSPN